MKRFIGRQFHRVLRGYLRLWELTGTQPKIAMSIFVSDPLQAEAALQHARYALRMECPELQMALPMRADEAPEGLIDQLPRVN